MGLLKINIDRYYYYEIEYIGMVCSILYIVAKCTAKKQKEESSYERKQH